MTRRPSSKARAPHHRELFARTPVHLPASATPRLMVVIDAEEEFDWSAGFDRNATSVRAMSSIGIAQELINGFGGTPVYVVDYPVASQERGFERLRAYASAGEAIIGAHLHPWVNPPFGEEISRRTSFAGNLPPELLSDKLNLLSEQLEASFGERPTIYKAGRYGIGPSTPPVLAKQGFKFDLSACPAFDFRGEHGPDFSSFSPDPYWFGPDHSLLGLPATGAFIGAAGSLGRPLFRWADRPNLRKARLPGLLARLRLVDRLQLSPEGFTFDELRRLTQSLIQRGSRVFTFSFHSPSLLPGCTPYVDSAADLDRFLDRSRRYFEFFLSTVGGEWTTPRDLLSRIQDLKGANQE